MAFIPRGHFWQSSTSLALFITKKRTVPFFETKLSIAKIAVQHSALRLRLVFPTRPSLQLSLVEGLPCLQGRRL